MKSTRKVSSICVVLFLCFMFSMTAKASETSQLIIINKATNELAFYDKGTLVKVFKVATGRDQSFTPEGTFSIVNKIKNRPYYKDNIPGGDPSNPLGDRWLGLDARGTYGTTYAIHGNNNPNSLGKYVSAGCVRMYNDEVRWLFDRVKLHTKVVITTSSDSFEKIAIANNYQVKAADIDVKITLFETTAFYNNVFDMKSAAGNLKPQVVTAKKQLGDWYLIDTWLGDKWIAPKKMIIGEIQPVSMQVALTQKTSLYDLPLSNSKLPNSLLPQTVTAAAEWNGWYKIKTSVGEKWINPEKAMAGIKTIDEKVQLTELAYLYDLPFKENKTPSRIAAQTVSANAEWNGWYQIQTWNGPKWIKPVNAMAGVKEINVKVAIQTTTLLHHLPFDKYKTTSSLSPQTVTATAQWNNWYKVQTWLGEMWIKPLP